MAERGFRNSPLIVSEYGIPMPEDYGFTPETVAAFLIGTFDYFLTAKIRTWVSRPTAIAWCNVGAGTAWRISLIRLVTSSIRHRATSRRWAKPGLRTCRIVDVRRRDAFRRWADRGRFSGLAPDFPQEAGDSLDSTPFRITVYDSKYY